jgi:hypothetical protein
MFGSGEICLVLSCLVSSRLVLWGFYLRIVEPVVPTLTELSGLIMFVVPVYKYILNSARVKHIEVFGI